MLVVIFMMITALATSITAIRHLFQEKKDFLDRTSKEIKNFGSFLKNFHEIKKKLGIGVRFVPTYAVKFDYSNLSEIRRELEKTWFWKRIPYRRLSKSIDSALQFYLDGKETFHNCCKRLMEETQKMLKKFYLNKAETIERHIKNDPVFLELPEASKEKILGESPSEFAIQLDDERTTSLYCFMFNPRLIKKIAKHYNAVLPMRDYERGIGYKPTFPPELWSDLRKEAESHFSKVKEAKEAKELLQELDRRIEILAKIFEKKFHFLLL